MPLPATVTVSPGASAHEISIDLERSNDYRDLDVTAHFSILCIGANEKFSLHNIIFDALCKRNIIQPEDCPICYRSQSHRNVILRLPEKHEYACKFVTDFLNYQ